ncbi:vitamin K epoxide reductase family protein [Histidinibacterium aquaticum]|uniref:NAD-dependent epimerase/dehydratase family protein n=1 Tax=Histidinibacterium aquaticum TaxID=2613962 RepID=A0A5J5GGF0_9RHOB|nr:vitamin K epoxide reductase family protein [Histidinibacterium aquaticum]KAA9006813.1 NAD-dependent epimerase/dehydratase family protein [Histidinibacterium aquaticum]
MSSPDPSKPVILITGIGGSVGQALVEVLSPDYQVVGLERDVDPGATTPVIEGDLTDDAAMELAMREIEDRFGTKLASVIHLAAYFDFTGQKSDAYDAVNVEGTRRLLRSIERFDVEQFVYTSTMLVHEPQQVGQTIDEDTPVDPGWAYPESKAETEEVITEERKAIPTVRLRLAGLYDDMTAVPTLSHQIARIYDRDMKAHFYSGDLGTGQAFIHADDMKDAVRRVVDRRAELGEDCTILLGETNSVSYQALQERIADLIHGQSHWRTITVPQSIARFGAWVETKSEPLVPDAFDEGDKPFIRPFMIDMASDHYALDTAKARELLDWEPKNRIEDKLETIVDNLKADPNKWYRANGIRPPVWMRSAKERGINAETLRSDYEQEIRKRHRSGLWAHWVNVGLAIWIITSPPIIGLDDPWMIASDLVAGTLLLACAVLSMSWRFGAARYGAAVIGLWLMFAPLIFWTDNGAAYLNGTLVGMLVTGLALGVSTVPGVSPAALMTGPVTPKGWSYTPSDWFQRIPVIALAVVGLIISRYLGAYQLETIPGVWDPLFDGTVPNKNGSEDIVTSSVSEAWPVPDAGVGALTYALEIIVGAIGSNRRWRTMPWLTVAFGVMIVPLGAISIFFIVIQPILIGTYCTLCLIAAAAMLIQIPYSVDELVATGQFLVRRHKAGQPWLRVFFTGDTDEGPDEHVTDDFERGPGPIFREMVTGGMSLPWTMGVSMIIGVALMLSPLLLTWENGLSPVNHIVGALVLTVSVTALASVLRLARYLNGLLGLVLIFAPFMTGAGLWLMLIEAATGVALILLCLPRGDVGKSSYGSWDKYIR